MSRYNPVQFWHVNLPCGVDRKFNSNQQRSQFMKLHEKFCLQCATAPEQKNKIIQDKSQNAQADFDKQRNRIVNTLNFHV